MGDSNEGEAGVGCAFSQNIQRMWKYRVGFCVDNMCPRGVELMINKEDCDCKDAFALCGGFGRCGAVGELRVCRWRFGH